MKRIMRTHHERGFTLIELLVVMTILTILLGLFIGAGVAVTRNARASATKNILLSLDRALEECMMANGGALPPFNRLAYAGVPGYDGPNGDASPMNYVTAPDAPMPQRPDASVFIRQAKGIGDVDAILASIPERFLVLTVIPQDQAPNHADVQANFADVSPSVVDSWADESWQGYSATGDVTSAWRIREQSLIYYVHPNNRRARADASLDAFPDAQELYGACANGRPYFMSAGPDGFYGHPEEIAAIVAHYGLAKQSSGESDEAFWNRALLQARKDNLYSTPVDINFSIKSSVLQNFNPPAP